METPRDGADIVVGAVATAGRVGVMVGRVALLPARMVARAPGVGSMLRRGSTDLASAGRDAEARGRRRLEEAAGGMLAAPEVERVIDRALAGPLPESVTRSIGERRVAERVGPSLLASADFEAAVVTAFEEETIERLVSRVLASPAFEQMLIDILESRVTMELTDRTLRSPEMQLALERVLSSPAIRAALFQQSTTLGEEMVTGARAKASRLDDAMDNTVRRWFRRPRRPAQAEADPRYAGLATRGVALAADALIANIGFLTAGALAGLVASLVGGVRPAWLVSTLVGVGWVLFVGTYFVLFWTTAGETPGMRLMRLRVTNRANEPPHLVRSLLRLVGLGLAIVLLFLGFLPVLFDDRRRALQDYLAGTVVVHDPQAALTVEQAPQLQTGQEGSPVTAVGGPEVPADLRS